MYLKLQNSIKLYACEAKAVLDVVLLYSTFESISLKLEIVSFL